MMRTRMRRTEHLERTAFRRTGRNVVCQVQFGISRLVQQVEGPVFFLICLVRALAEKNHECGNRSFSARFALVLSSTYCTLCDRLVQGPLSVTRLPTTSQSRPSAVGET